LVAEGRAAIPLSNPRMGYFEQEPEDWWSAAGSALRELTGKVEASLIAGLAISNQRETFGAFDRGGRSLRPGMIWLDDRARENVAPFGERFGAVRIHAISGRALDLNPCLYRLHWMQEHEPETFDAMEIVADVHGYVVFRLTGRWAATSIASADATGMIDMVGRGRSQEILDAVGISESKVLSLAAPGAWLGEVAAASAAATGLREGTPVFAGGGDGQCAGTGAGALLSGWAFVNLGMAVVAGTYRAGVGELHGSGGARGRSPHRPLRRYRRQRLIEPLAANPSRCAGHRGQAVERHRGVFSGRGDRRRQRRRMARQLRRDGGGHG
jgi:sugar (pentulose or hexulose) kinase